MSDRVIDLVKANWDVLLEKHGKSLYAMRIEDIYSLVAPKPMILYTPLAEMKIHALVKESTIEISWHGLVEKINDMTYLITDILMYPQTCTAATVTTDDEKYTNWLHSQPDEIFNKIRYQGHSHVRMGVMPSGVDLNYYRDMIKNLKKDDFYLFEIRNKTNEMNIRLYQNNDIPEWFVNRELQTTIAINGTPSDVYAQRIMSEFIQKKEYPKPPLEDKLNKAPKTIKGKKGDIKL